MNQIVYISSADEQKIHVWKMNDKGSLNLIQIIDTPGQGCVMTSNYIKRSLYLGVRPLFGIVSYSIDHGGMLRESYITPIPVSPTHLTTNSLGSNLYCSSYSGSCLLVSSIDDKGVISKPIQIIRKLTTCHSSNIDINNQTLWVPCLKEDRIHIFKITNNGILISNYPESINSDIGSGPRHMVFHFNGAYAYVINELNSSINIYHINTFNKYPCKIQTLDIMPKGFNNTRWAADIHITPDGRYLYCCDRTASIITGFSISKDGSILSLIGHFNTEAQPREFNIDKSGQFIISAGQKSNHISVSKIDKISGKLIMLSRYIVGQGPISVSIIRQ